jgi:hypothetical protein
MGEKDTNNDQYKMFGSRKEVDNYKANLLISDEQHFLKDIEQIRQEFNIPIFLKPCMDTYIGYLLGTDRVYDDLFPGGYTHGLLNEKNRELFKEAIVSIIKKYELGMNFLTWVQYFILYKETLPEGVVLNLRLIEQTAKDWEELFRVPKNSQEIKTYLSWFKSSMGISKTGRIPQKYRKYIKTTERIFNKRKLKERKPRVDHSIDYKTIKEHGKNETYENFGLGEKEQVKITYEYLVAKYLPEAPIEYDKRNAAMLRKRKERLIKQQQKHKS